jgi:hypothetical protein
MSSGSKPNQRRNLAIEVSKALAALSPFPIEQNLTNFRKQKEALLSHLQSAYERGGEQAKPFDRDEAWSEIEYVAIYQQSLYENRKQTMGASDRNAKLREMADVLTQTRRLIENVAQSPEIGSELMDAWVETTHDTTLADVTHIYREFPREFEEAIKGLAHLQEAAVRAATQIKIKRGRPEESSYSFAIYWLAHIYRSYTGSRPGAGDGPFARFVEAYMSALGRGIVYDSLVDIIKASRVKAQRRHSELTPSPFEN